MSALASQLILWLIVGASLILAGLMRVSGRSSEEERMTIIYEHTCTACGRVQRWTKPFAQFSLCRACQIADLRRPIEIDLDDFADADAIRVYLSSADVLRSSQSVAQCYGDATDSSRSG